MAQRVTKGAIRQAMARIEKDQSLENLQAGAQLLGRDVRVDGNGNHLYLGGVYPDKAAFVDELLIDMGSRMRSL